MKKEIFIFLIFFLLSLLFWIAINLNEEYVVHIYIPIEIKTLNEDFAIEGFIPEKFDVLLSGSGWELIKIKTSGNRKYSINISSIEEEIIINSSKITNEQLNLPPTVKILNVNPDVIRFRSKAALTKRIKIFPDLEMVVKEGYGIVSPIFISPESLIIRGSKKNLSLIDSIPTQKINLGEVSSDVSIETTIVDTLKNLVFYEKPKIKINFKVQQIVDREYQRIEIKLKNIPRGEEIICLPSYVNIKLRGGIDLLSNLPVDSINVIINLSKLNLTEQDYVTPEFILPYGITVIDYFPKYFKLIQRK